MEARLRWQRQPLHAAVEHGVFRGVEMLLAAGANLEAEARFQVRPLDLALEFGHTAIASLLLNHNASIDRGDNLELLTFATLFEKPCFSVLPRLVRRDPAAQPAIVQWSNANSIARDAGNR